MLSISAKRGSHSVLRYSVEMWFSRMSHKPTMLYVNPWSKSMYSQRQLLESLLVSILYMLGMNMFVFYTFDIRQIKFSV